VLELVHALVEALDKHFGQVCELDIMSEPDTVHYILDEMVLNGSVLDTNRTAVLEQVALLEKYGEAQ
jgi:AP-4 complex subunit sigma-1